MTSAVEDTTRLVVLVPAVAAALGLLLARRRAAAAAVAVGAAALTLAAAAYTLFVVHHDQFTPTVTTIRALPLGELRVPLLLLADDLSAVVAVAVAIVGLSVQAFTRSYLREDDRYGAFAATVSLFLAGMLLVVQSGDLILTLVGWEVMGWCSYLLIGHDSRREAARRAAVKAFLVTRVADLAFVIGLVILASGARTTSIPEVLAYWTGRLPCLDTGACLAPDTGMLTAAMLCLLSGIAGKSAMFPFHDWLPDAMEGPTPASALIHAATMVAAGTFVLARLFDVFAASEPARLVLALLTSVTMVGAAILAFGQSDLKRLLAYSTLSQIAIMLSALAVAPAGDGPGAGVLHLLSHAMFKALLFLAIGWLSILVGGTAAVAMSGGVRHHRALARPIGIGLLALAGVPPLVGFVSKEYVLGSAVDGAGEPTGGAAGWVVLICIGATVALTAAYCMRAWLVLRHLTPDEEEVYEEELDHSYHPDEVTLTELLTDALVRQQAVRPQAGQTGPVPEPLPAVQHVDEEGNGHDAIDGIDAIDAGARGAVGGLAILSVVGGAIVLTPLVPGIHLHFGVWAVGVSLVLILGAAGAVRLMTPHAGTDGAGGTGGTGDAADRLGPARVAGFDRGLGVDGVYVALTRPVLVLARAVVTADREVIDAYVRGAVVATRWAGVGGARAHTGKPSSYLVWVLLGLLAVGVAGASLW